MTTANLTLIPVQFHGDTLDAFSSDGRVWVSLRRCCENIGVDFASQLTKLRGKSWACVAEITTHDNSGRRQPLTMIDLESLPMWLATIDERKVKSGVRERLVRYQKEAAKVLADHFFPAAPPSLPQPPRRMGLLDRIMQQYQAHREVEALKADLSAHQQRITVMQQELRAKEIAVRVKEIALLEMAIEAYDDPPGTYALYHSIRRNSEARQANTISE